jgi:hypothetical protein
VNPINTRSDVVVAQGLSPYCLSSSARLGGMGAVWQREKNELDDDVQPKDDDNDGGDGVKHVRWMAPNRT